MSELAKVERNSGSRLADRSDRSTSVLPRTPFSELLGFDPFELLRGVYGSPGLTTSLASTGVNVSRTENGYVVEIPVAGFAPDQIEVTYHDGTVSVSGKNERRSFTRSLTIPDEIDPNSISAKVEHGLLVLQLSLRPEAQPRQIPISKN
jgi:HSP20 family molecular chaperone IbpA